MKKEKRLTAISFAAVLCGAFSVFAAEDCVKASSFGWNAEDSTAALQAAFDSGAKKVIVDRQAGDWIARPLFITNSNLEVVFADGVTLRAKRGEFHRKGDCLIKVTGGASNIVLRGEGKAVLRMNKADYLNPEMGYVFSEWRHTVSLLIARNVTVKDLTLLSSGGDGVYVRGTVGVTLENLVIRDHNRQGMSPISVENMTVRRCCFNETFGAPPQCGIDMEPNRETDRFVNVVYEDCVFDGNRSHGIDMFFGWFTSRTKPVSITFRRCKARGNGNAGVSFMTGAPVHLDKYGQVRGFVKFEDCEFSGNGAEALKVFNHSTKGMDICFRDCVFDARDSRAENAILFTNSRYLGDLGGMSFERCTVKLDKGRKVCSFEAQRGIGIGGKLEGVLAVERDGKKEEFDLSAFAAKYVPQPELVVRFKAAEVDFRELGPMSDPSAVKGVFTPFIRKPFVYVVAVPAAGEYKVRFGSRKLRQLGTGALAAVVQLLDRAGTDLGQFDVPVGDFEYTLKSRGPNVYRFEVSNRNSAVIRMACDGAAGALQTDSAVHLFKGANEVFNFCVPASAELVSVGLEPIERVQAELIDPSGNVVRKTPYTNLATVFEVKRPKAERDEIWKLRFVKIQEDMKFRIGGDALPLASTDENGVINRKPAKKK